MLETRFIHRTVLLLFLSVSCIMVEVDGAELEVVKEFTRERPGNLAVTPDGRVFFTVHALTDSKIQIRELLKNGRTPPFPSLDWAQKPTEPGSKGIVKTIGIKASSQGDIWVLDMGELPLFEPALIQFDSKKRTFKRKFVIPKEYLGDHPFLQDFVLDEKRNKIYIADMDFNQEKGESEKPAIIVVDVTDGKIRRALEADPTMMPDQEPIVVNSKEIASVNSKGETVTHYYGLNPITIDPANEWVYYGAMSGKKVYRLPAEELAKFNLNQTTLSKSIEEYGPKPFSDGILVDDKGNVYITDIMSSAIGVTTPSSYRVLYQDKNRLPWPDGFALHDNQLYIVANELNTLPGLNKGKDESTPPFYIHRISIK
ncbi:L-dopachrome tautomerase-related protein [Bacillus coahuilensis]|nr:L-dopachrome tautomerase-related protein [Bacillus coahuilensis]